VITACREIGFDIPDAIEAQRLADLQTEFERVVRIALEREEQARIKAQIREEQRLEREARNEVDRLQREQDAIRMALVAALEAAADEHSAEIEALRFRLAEAERKALRAVSQAQLTKSGHVYVISNIGSFGDNVFKIGMTRRLEPLDRVKELGDASVPFPFDVHMMVSSNDAPTLENQIHKQLHRLRVNKANPRKEFFRTEIEAIRRIVEDHHGQVEYVADAEALEFRQSMEMTEEESEFIEQTYENAVNSGRIDPGDDDDNGDCDNHAV
jgi:multidrug efflux pump subunit AcrA (membrane-fusion protein)